MTRPTSPRRWFRYSMRTLLVVITLACIWLGTVVNRAEQQRRTVATLRASKAQVEYDTPLDVPGGQPSNWRWLRSWLGNDYFDDVISVELKRGSIDDQTLRRICKFSELRTLTVGESTVTDDGFRAIARLRKLERLLIRSPHLTDEGVSALAENKGLHELWLVSYELTDDCIDTISQLDGLVELGIGSFRISDCSLPQLGRMSNLETLAIGIESGAIADKTVSLLVDLPKLTRLHLGNNQLTDEGLTKLKSMVRLRHLGIACSDPKYTAQGVDALQAQLPYLEVTHNAYEPSWNGAEEGRYPTYRICMPKRRK